MTDGTDTPDGDGTNEGFQLSPTHFMDPSSNDGERKRKSDDTAANGSEDSAAKRLKGEDGTSVPVKGGTYYSIFGDDVSNVVRVWCCSVQALVLTPIYSRPNRRCT